MLSTLPLKTSTKQADLESGGYQERYEPDVPRRPSLTGACQVKALATAEIR
ncbi:MAG: hypothetical protein QOH70_1882 [Blastocatellia bacterium]|jgi:hypothetical protein|nr:hypothetical protein [Blastocatellia bacterium]